MNIRSSTICALLFATAVLADAPQLEFKTLTYASSVDGTAPLFVDVCWLPDGRKKPLLVVMHGYGGSRKDVDADVKALAARGVVAIAPDMRGRGDSAGKWDSGGLDVHDITGAVLAVVDELPGEVDARNLNIVGYSGGGGNAISCAVRFPDLFRNCISFFGIADYAGWHASKGRPDCNRGMEKALGGPPDKLPDVYLARNAIPAASNALLGKLHFFWDAEETQCPPGMIERFIERYRTASGKNIAVHVSRPGDTARWIHGYRTSIPDLSKADDLFLPDVLVTEPASPRLPPKGRLVVPGYLVTRHFQVWLADGQRGQATIDYDLTGKKPVVTIFEKPANIPVRVVLESPLGRLP